MTKQERAVEAEADMLIRRAMACLGKADRITRDENKKDSIAGLLDVFTDSFELEVLAPDMVEEEEGI